MATGERGEQEAWPRLDVGRGAETRASLLLWGQIVGKTRLALTPMVNHWWQVPFILSARGLTTAAMPIWWAWGCG